LGNLGCDVGKKEKGGAVFIEGERCSLIGGWVGAVDR
jgi:hypothetical protein